MGLLDKALRYARKNPQGVERGLGKAANTINARTGGKHAGTVEKLTGSVRKLTGGGAPRRGR